MKKVTKLGIKAKGSYAHGNMGCGKVGPSSCGIGNRGS